MAFRPPPLSLLALLAFAPLVVVSAPALLAYAGAPTVAAALFLAHDPLCHQLPERSLSLLGGQLAVCSRCTGILAGIPLGLAAARLRTPGTQLPVWVLPLFAVPLAVDWLGTAQGAWPPQHAARFCTGLLAITPVACRISAGLLHPITGVRP